MSNDLPRDQDTDPVSEVRSDSNLMEEPVAAIASGNDIGGTLEEVIVEETDGTAVEIEMLDLIQHFETDQTKGLSNEQLQRIVLLKQMKVLELQQKKLELDIARYDVPVLFDISSLNVSNALPSNGNV